MKPSITPERLYGNADFSDIRGTMIPDIHRLITKLEDAKIVETARPILEVDHHLIKAQLAAQEHWRGIIEMLSKQKEYE